MTNPATKAPSPRKRQPAKPPAAPSAIAAVADAKRRASIPSRPVIQHTKLLRAELHLALQAMTAALAADDRDLANAAGERDETMEANRREYEAKDALAVERFRAIRSGIDANRADVIRAMEGIEAALAATGEPKANVIQMHSEGTAA